MYNVLVVEDEAVIRTGFIGSIPWSKYDCTVCAQASNGREGLELIRSCRPEIVFTDIRMPIMDGLDMLSAAKSEYDFEAVVLSGYSEFAYAQRAITLGVSDYILKPFDEAALCETVENIVHRLDEKRALMPRAEYGELSVPAGASHYTKRGYDFLMQNYKSGITGADIADYLDISPGYFYKLFKADTGVSVHSFILKLRLTKALMLMENDPCLKIYEVADLVGFADYKYFHRAFTAQYGQSPLKYKQSMFGECCADEHE